MPDKTVTVRHGQWHQRQYELHELFWLHRTAQLPHDAEYQRKDGTWASVEELVEPLLSKETERQPEASAKQNTPRDSNRLYRLLILAGVGIIILGIPDAFTLWQHRQQFKSEADELERSERMKDHISSGRVAIDMTPEQVLQAWGRPKQIVHEGDKQRWIYKRGTLILRDGTVVSLDGAAP